MSNILQSQVLVLPKMKTKKRSVIEANRIQVIISDKRTDFEKMIISQQNAASIGSKVSDMLAN